MDRTVSRGQRLQYCTSSNGGWTSLKHQNRDICLALSENKAPQNLRMVNHPFFAWKVHFFLIPLIHFQRNQTQKSNAVDHHFCFFWVPHTTWQVFEIYSPFLDQVSALPRPVSACGSNCLASDCPAPRWSEAVGLSVTTPSILNTHGRGSSP